MSTPTSPTPPTFTEADLSAQVDALFAEVSPVAGSEPSPPGAPEHGLRADPAPVSTSTPLAPPAAARTTPAATPASSPATSPASPTTAVQPAAVIPPTPAPVVHAGPRGGALLQALAVASIPIESKPPVVRSAVGWIALNTLVLGALLWAYVLFFRPAPEQAHAKAFNFTEGRVPVAPTPSADAPKAANAAPGASKSASKSAESHGGGH
ncbi:MAG: hypothetical protein HBSAPP03_09850 [Phycisphaerae bacterium]|nr:MAG: hypothetical protein HBSAPP03_09850 [Phycisphaerae bacterium]